MNEWIRWETEKQLQAAAEALKANGFDVVVVENNREAADRIEEFARDAQSVGFAGSITISGMGLRDKFIAAGKTVLDHSLPGLSAEEKLEMRRRQLTADLFLTSSNAVTLDGKLVNVDATGNRVGGLTFGPKHSVVVAGSNKLVSDAEAGLQRISEWAAPANAKRLSMKTPCATTGFCEDCDSPARICRVVHVMEKRPRFSKITVILVTEHSGL